MYTLLIFYSIFFFHNFTMIILYIQILCIYILINMISVKSRKFLSCRRTKVSFLKSFIPFFSLNFDSRYIHNTISDDRIEMSINPGIRGVPANFNPSHATITVETCDPDTKEKEYRRSVDLSNYNYYLVMFSHSQLDFQCLL